MTTPFEPRRGYRLNPAVALRPEPFGAPAGRVPALVEQFKGGLAAPICLTWEWTYACNLSCTHCLSSSGRRDPGELTTEQMRSVIDELRAMQVFYVNVGGGEPTVRPDFWELLDYAVASGVGVKFSTNGLRLDAERARRLAATDYVDVQISLDGASADVNDAVRGEGSYAMALRAMEHLAEAGFPNFKSQGGCMAAKFFTGLPLDGPDPECVKGHGADALAAAGRSESPRADKDHSHRSRPAQPIRPPGPTSRGRAVSLGMPAVHVPARPCDSSPLATVL